MDENWLTAIFNKYLAGVANAILGLVNLKANDPAHPWETWLVMELLVFVILILLVAAVRPHFSADRPGKLQHLFETIYAFLQTQASEVAGKSITTIEGLSPDSTHPVQKAWLAERVPQCGYCQSGQIMSAADLLKQNPKPTREQIVEHMSTNICRCGTYQRIVRAVERAAREA